MKIVNEFANNYGRFTIFEMNNKFIVKIEKGNYEQIYKLNTLDFLIQSADDITKIFDEMFLKNVEERFLQMHKDFNSSIERNGLS